MFKIISGNIPFSYTYSAGFSHDKLWDFGKPDIIIKDNIAQFEYNRTVRGLRFISAMVGSLIGAIACGHCFGWIGVPFGCYFGTMLFGSHTRQVFTVCLTDGRRFMAIADTNTYKKLLTRARISIYTQTNQRAAH